MIIITGGCGFLGSHLAEKLSGSAAVRIIDNMSLPSKAFRQNSGLEVVKADLLEDCSSSFYGADVVYHLAACSDVRIGADNPKFMLDTNITGTLNVLEACRKTGVGKVVFASSSVVYGNAAVPTPESHPIDPVSTYGISKVCGEIMLKHYAENYGIKAIVLRYANFFGPGSTHGVMHDFFHKLKTNPKQLGILGDGSQKKSYIYITDAAEASIFAAENSKEQFAAFNIGTEEARTVNEIADIMINHLGLNNVQKIYSGGRQGWPGDVPLMLLDISKIKNLGWSPKVSFEQGVKNYMEWMKENYT